MNRSVLVLILVFFASVLLAQELPQPEPKQDIELLQQKLKLLEQQLADKDKKIAELEETIKHLEEAVASGRPPEPSETPSEIVHEGRVSLYNAEKRMVIVTLGSAHNLKEGDSLFLFHEGKQTGELRVCRILDSDMSNAEIVKADPEPAVGDIVRLVQKQQPEVPSEKLTPPVVSKDISETLQRISDALEKINKRLEEDSAILLNIRDRLNALSRLPKESSTVTKKEPAGSEPTKEPSSTETSEQPSEPKTTEKTKPSEALVANVFSVMDQEGERIVLNVGKKHGVKVGDIFVLYRDGEMIAKASVAGVIDDMAQAFVFDKKKDVKVQERDIAVRR